MLNQNWAFSWELIRTTDIAIRITLVMKTTVDYYFVEGCSSSSKCCCSSPIETSCWWCWSCSRSSSPSCRQCSDSFDSSESSSESCSSGCRCSIRCSARDSSLVVLMRRSSSGPAEKGTSWSGSAGCPPGRSTSPLCPSENSG